MKHRNDSMRSLGFFVGAMVLLLTLSAPLQAQRTIYIPRTTDAHNFQHVEDGLRIRSQGKRHDLKAAVIKGIFVGLANQLGLDLNGFARFTLNARMQGSSYDYRTDKYNAGKGNYEVFIPYQDIERITYIKRPGTHVDLMAAIHLRDSGGTIYAYCDGLEISGEESVEGSGRTAFSAILEAGDEVEFPPLQESTIRAVSTASAVVTLDDGTKRSISDIRPTTIPLAVSDSGGALKIEAIPIDKVSEIRVIDTNKLLLRVRLVGGGDTTGSLGWNEGGFAGICGKGVRWYEQFDWRAIQELRVGLEKKTVGKGQVGD